jgi:hypothetical protein
VVQDAVLTVLKGAVLGAAVMGGGDLLIPGLRILTNGRKQMDWSSVEARLVGGAVFGAAFDFLKGLADILPQVLGRGVNGQVVVPGARPRHHAARRQAAGSG